MLIDGLGKPRIKLHRFHLQQSVINGSVCRIERRRRFVMKCDLSDSTSTKHRKAPYDRISALNDFICLCEKEARPDIVQSRMIEGRCVLSRKGNVVVLCSVFTSISEL
jgi:hypothetical protein